MAKTTETRAAEAQGQGTCQVQAARPRPPRRQGQASRRRPAPPAGRRAAQEPSADGPRTATSGPPDPRRPPRRPARRPRQGSRRASPAITCFPRAWPRSRPRTTCGSSRSTASGSAARGGPPGRPPEPGRPDRPAVAHHRGQRQRGRPPLRLGQRRPDRRRPQGRGLPDRRPRTSGSKARSRTWGCTRSRFTSARTSTPRSSSGSSRPTPTRRPRPEPRALHDASSKPVRIACGRVADPPFFAFSGTWPESCTSDFASRLRLLVGLSFPRNPRSASAPANRSLPRRRVRISSHFFRCRPGPSTDTIVQSRHSPRGLPRVLLS